MIECDLYSLLLIYAENGKLSDRQRPLGCLACQGSSARNGCLPCALIRTMSALFDISPGNAQLQYRPLPILQHGHANVVGVQGFHMQGKLCALFSYH